MTALIPLARPLLRPVHFAALGIERDADAPSCLIAPILVAAARLDQRLNLRAVEIGAHHAHPLAIAPVELAVLLIEVDLLRRMSVPLWDDDLAILAVDVGALDRAIVHARDTHVGPVDVTGFGIHHDAIGKSAIGHDRLFVGPVRVHRMNAAGVQLENE